MTGIIYDELFLEHGELWHPENRRRLEAVMAHLQASEIAARLAQLKPVPATREELAWLHDEEYIETLEQVSAAGGDAFTVDTIATRDTFAAAALAAGGCIAAARAAISDDPARAMCLVRPPGHHAGAGAAHGFCFFANAALAAEAALRAGAPRVAIVDFDVHHGDGTQELFYHRRDVLYVSLHETPLFPGTGSFDEVGVEDGAGFTINIPLLAGAGDAHYTRAFSEVVIPALDEFQPELLIVSAGYDAHHADPLAHMNASATLFHTLTQMLAASASRHCAGRMVVVLEGGYDRRWLPRCIENTLRALSGEQPQDFDEALPPTHPEQTARVEDALERVIDVHRERLGL